MRIALVLLILPILPHLPAQKTEAEKAEKRHLRTLAIKCLQLAEAVAGNPTESKRAFEFATKFGAKEKQIDATRAKIESAEESDPTEAQKKKAHRLRRDVVNALDRLTKTRRPPPSAIRRFDDYMFDAFVLDPGNQKRLALLRKRVESAARKGDLDRVQHLLGNAKVHDSEGADSGRYLAAAATIGKKHHLIVNARNHPLQAMVLIPKKWTPKAKAPVLVYIDGAGCRFEEAAKVYRPIIDKENYVLVIPYTFSNGNELEASRYPYDPKIVQQYAANNYRQGRIRWDVEGLDDVLAQVTADYATDDRLFWTCWSGGGMLTYWWIHHRPETLRAVAPASPNYWSWCKEGGKASKDGHPPVRIFTGSEDSAGQARIFPQSDEAVVELKKMKLKDVERVHLPGRGHDRFEREVMDFFRTRRNKK
ncbi:MAG: hypothetical protein CMJ83_07095 [Planctomycetes bacterium]|nr:hypothetical protein [Planctomycetota bacterium]